MYRLRFISLMLRCLFSPPRQLLDNYDLHFIAIPFIDTDVSRMFTHAYSALMALGRWQYLFASEFRTVALKKRWVPVTTAETIVYKKSIKAFTRGRLQTRLLCWNESRFYLEQKFFVGDEVKVLVYLEGLVRGPQGHLNPVQVFSSLGLNQASPEMPEKIKSWAQSLTKDFTKEPQ